MEVTIALLQNAMREALAAQGKTAAGHAVPDEHKGKWTEGRGRFLVDGFPRKMDQAIKFDEMVSGAATFTRWSAQTRPLRSRTPCAVASAGWRVHRLLIQRMM